MMTKLEIKKILNNRKNRLLIIAAFLGAIVFSIFAIDSFRFVDVNDNIKKRFPSGNRFLEQVHSNITTKFWLTKSNLC